MKQFLSFVLASSAALLTACNDQTTQPRSLADGPNATVPARRDINGDTRPVGGVYVSTNGASGNAIVAFARFESGALEKLGEFNTGGLGIGGGGDPLQSQGSVVVSRDHQTLFVVNAGSNTISTFTIDNGAALHLRGTVSSFGSGPISLAVTDQRLFVLNLDNSIASYSIAGAGLPTPLGQLSLGPASDGPSTINASRDGHYVFVTERAGNAIAVATVDERGNITSAGRRASSGGGPFGFAVTSRDQLVVSEAGAGAVSSYKLAGGTLSLITGSLSTQQAAPCWLVLSNDERFAFVANAGSGSIGGFAVSPDGVLTPLSPDGRTGVTNGSGATPLDIHVTRDGKFLYALQTGTGTVGSFAIGATGSLTTLPDTPGLAAVAGFQGLAAF
ncbi:MAG TPA: beta-propeller fold lactonase family protein [Gemmatimonadaceae bacterium]|jgi:6-phosphogluconolactonase (cycloisomerase 2 family)|nr:beta-propeller fold lactonase family protein [Gemmatimonadaceae bacterium]